MIARSLCMRYTPDSPVFCSLCSCSVTPSYLTLCHPLDCNPPGSLSMGIFRQEYWSGLPFPIPGDLPSPGVELSPLAFPALLADSYC